MYIPRYLDLKAMVQNKSLFLFGARQTGKTSLVRHGLPDCRVYDLLDSSVYLGLSREPQRLEQELQPGEKVLVIDEIQKLPQLHDEVHRLIETRGIHFLLTGSSARKLRRGGVNLLGGRARSRHLHPFISRELGEQFDLSRALNRGLIPSIYFSDAPEEDLKAYTGDYLKEEIAAEALTRNIPAFSRFLQVAALCNSLMINHAALASDAQVPASTVREYFQVLRDTLIGFDLPAWKRSRKRKAITTSKFYFFDPGVARYLQNRPEIREKSPEFGEAFETYMAHELKSYVDYRGTGELCYWRSASGFEVDFILDDRVAIEVKAKEQVSPRDLRGLRALMEEKQVRHYAVASLEQRPRTVNGIHILPWKEVLMKLWNEEFT